MLNVSQLFKNPTIKLYATPLSHFSRKVRVLLDLYQIPYEMIDIGNVANNDSKQFAENPMMKVPILFFGDVSIIESDHIAMYLVNQFDSDDRYGVITSNVFDLNARAMMNGIMSEEVKLILGQRTGINIHDYVFFQKSLKAITNGLEWLESKSEKFNSAKLSYREIHFICMWDHLKHYRLVALDQYPKLNMLANHISTNEIIHAFSPQMLNHKSQSQQIFTSVRSSL